MATAVPLQQALDLQTGLIIRVSRIIPRVRLEASTSASRQRCRTGKAGPFSDNVMAA